jgi:hypothetical protein
MPRDPEPVSKILKSEAMAPFQDELHSHSQLLKAVRTCLPPFLAEHCQYCVAEDDTLLLYTSTPGIAYQLRFYLPKLLQDLAEATGTCYRDAHIRNTATTGTVHAFQKPHVFNPPPRNAAEALRDSAEHSPDPELREALLRLSRTVEELSRAAAANPSELPPPGPPD